MGRLQELPDRVHRVPIQFLEPGGRESHRDYSPSDVGQVEVVPELLEPLLGTPHQFSKKVHYKKCHSHNSHHISLPPPLRTATDWIGGDLAGASTSPR
jgi:hypothetical protein